MYLLLWRILVFTEFSASFLAATSIIDERRHIINYCKSDIDNYCQLKFKTIHCLHQNRDNLSNNCIKAIQETQFLSCFDEIEMCIDKGRQTCLFHLRNQTKYNASNINKACIQHLNQYSFIQYKQLMYQNNEGDEDLVSTKQSYTNVIDNGMIIMTLKLCIYITITIICCVKYNKNTSSVLIAEGLESESNQIQ